MYQCGPATINGMRWISQLQSRQKMPISQYMQKLHIYSTFFSESVHIYIYFTLLCDNYLNIWESWLEIIQLVTPKSCNTIKIFEQSGKGYPCCQISSQRTSSVNSLINPKGSKSVSNHVRLPNARYFWSMASTMKLFSVIDTFIGLKSLT